MSAANKKLSFLSFKKGGSTYEITDEQARADIDELSARVTELAHVPISITSFQCTPEVCEAGATVSEVGLSWSLSRDPKTMTLDGEALTPLSTRTRDLRGLSIKADKSWTLRVTDELDKAAMATAGVKFYAKTYWGAYSGQTIDGATLAAMGGALKAKGGHTITVEGGLGLYAWYALPKAYGEVKFSMGGFAGDFLDPVEVSVTNSLGHTEVYYAYRSTNMMTSTITLNVEVK